MPLTQTCQIRVWRPGNLWNVSVSLAFTSFSPLPGTSLSRHCLGGPLPQLDSPSTMKKNESYSPVPGSDKEVDIIDIKGIEDIGYVQQDAIVSNLFLPGQTDVWSTRINSWNMCLEITVLKKNWQLEGFLGLSSAYTSNWFMRSLSRCYACFAMFCSLFIFNGHIDWIWATVANCVTVSFLWFTLRPCRIVSMFHHFPREV